VRRWLASLFRPAPEAVPRFEPVGDAQFRTNVITLCRDSLAARKTVLGDQLRADPPAHPGELFYTLEKLTQFALELAMIDWREGKDPSPWLADVREAFATALAVRPDILAGHRNPGQMAILSDLMGWHLPFETAPPGEDDLKYAMIWMDRWIIAGLADPSCWPLKAGAPQTKIRFINTCLDDYWALLTGSIDPDEGMRRCIANYERRATHPTFKALRSTDAGGRYNALFVDLTLAAIMKKRGLVSGSVHDWRWG
jgi:hypothetical protein